MAEPDMLVFRRLPAWRAAGGNWVVVQMALASAYLAWIGWQVYATAHSLLLVALVSFVLLMLGVAGFDFHARQHGRLTLTHDVLRYDDGSRWAWRQRRASWALDLNAVRARHLPLGWAGMPQGSRLIWNLFLVWGRGPHMGQVRPAEWALAKGAALPAPTGEVAGRTQAGDDALEARMAALPLLMALCARGVSIPPVTWRYQGAGQIGFDLTASPRLRLALAALATVGATAAALHVALLSEHYFVPPPLAMWVAVGALVAAVTAWWLWREPVATVQARVGPTELRVTQVMVAVLLGAVVAACAPTLPLLAGRVLAPGQQVSFVWRPEGGAAALHSVGRPDVPAIEPHWRVATALLLRPGQRPLVVPVRRGLGGLWWQYDAGPLLADASTREGLRP